VVGEPVADQRAALEGRGLDVVDRDRDASPWLIGSKNPLQARSFRERPGNDS
jgi:hypothetical protein